MTHDDLIDIAEHLARLEPGRPRRTSLRRAVSTAYYALFHALAFMCADRLVGWAKSWEAFTPIYRSLDHANAKKVFRRIPIQHDSEIGLIGQTFILLQERRHTADYDPEPFPFGRSETLGLVDQARQSIRMIAALPAEKSLMLAAQLVARSRPS